MVNQLIYNPSTGRYEYAFGGDLTLMSGLNTFGGAAGNLVEATNSPLGTIGGGALKGAAAGAALGPLGAAIGGGIGLVGGLFKNKANREAEEAQRKMIDEQNVMNSLYAQQNANKMYEQGGSLNQAANITQYNGPQHEQGGIPLNEGNEVEGGETRGMGDTGNYIFSDVLSPKNSKKTFAQISKDIEKKYKNMETDKFAIESKNKKLAILKAEQENLKAEKFAEQLRELQQTDPDKFAELINSGQIQPPQGEEVPMTEMNPLTESGSGFADQTNSYSPSRDVKSTQLRCGGTMKGYELGGELLNQPYHIMPNGQIMPGATHEDYSEYYEDVEYREGGTIHIKPSKRGTFTTAAKKRGMGVQEFASKVLANKENYSTAMVKKANFAKNASKWNRNGGPLDLLNTNIPPIDTEPKIIDNALPANRQLTTQNTAYINNPTYTDEYGNSYTSREQRDRMSNNRTQVDPNLINKFTNEEMQSSYNIWGNYPNFNPNLIDQTQGDDIRYSTYQMASNPRFVADIPNQFKPEDMDAYREYYKGITGKDYPESYENIMNRVVRKSLNEAQNGVIDEGYLRGTELLTLPSLVAFLNQRMGKPTGGPTGSPNGQYITPPQGGPTDKSPVIPPVPIDYTDLQNTSTGGNPTIEGGGNQERYIGQGLPGFRPDWLQAGLSALPAIGTGIGSALLARNLKYDRAKAEIAQPDYVDPTRAIQETRNQYAGAKDLIRQNAGSAGSYLSNIIGATAGQSEAEAGIQAQYDNINAGISNQFAQFNAQQKQHINQINAQIGLQEKQDKIGLKQNAISNIGQGIATGIDTYYKSKRDATNLNLAGGENFYYRAIGPAWNQKAVKVFRGNGFQYYEDPESGITIYMSPDGTQITEKSEIKKLEKLVNKSIEDSKVKKYEITTK